jgi:hypothetical protein
MYSTLGTDLTPQTQARLDKANARLTKVQARILLFTNKEAAAKTSAQKAYYHRLVTAKQKEAAALQAYIAKLIASPTAPPPPEVLPPPPELIPPPLTGETPVWIDPTGPDPTGTLPIETPPTVPIIPTIPTEIITGVPNAYLLLGIVALFMLFKQRTP